MSLREARQLTSPLEQAILTGCAALVVVLALASVLPKGAFLIRVALGVASLASMVIAYVAALRGPHFPG